MRWDLRVLQVPHRGGLPHASPDRIKRAFAGGLQVCRGDTQHPERRIMRAISRYKLDRPKSSPGLAFDPPGEPDSPTNTYVSEHERPYNHLSS